MHPFSPADQTSGYDQVIEDLEEWLCAITGFAAISFQPNSGAQGEYTGLLTIRAYHQANGDHQRKIALIPSSAHGTNPCFRGYGRNGSCGSKKFRKRKH